MADEDATARRFDPVPCPFCGSGRMQTCVDDSNRGEGKPAIYYISCEDCDVDGPPADTIFLAKKKWNYRVLVVGDITAVKHA